nr:pathogenesis-related protein 5-like [Tanacetum cinerariifolium]
MEKTIMLFLFLFFISGGKVSAGVFTLQNSCSYTVWPGTLSGNAGIVLGDGGFSLAPGASVQFPAMPGWSGRFWARTGCTFDESGNGRCVTGDCGNTIKCNGGGSPPVSLAEFTIAGGISNSDKDFYDVSLVDGYNVGIGIRPTGGSGDCQYAGCIADLNVNCPPELRVVDGNSAVVACKSACDAFNVPEFCCTGEHATPATCAPTQFSVMFKAACPSAYSYAYDDASTGGISNSDKDFYDVSLVDGYNVGIGIRPTGGSGDCQYAGCIADLNVNCPPELRVVDGNSAVVACKSACDAFNVPEFCCTGEHATPATCAPTQFSVMFKAACPSAYSYAYDDASSTFTCSGSDYLITFCPTNSI